MSSKKLCAWPLPASKSQNIPEKKPHIFILHGKWHCTSKCRFVYGVGETPSGAYRAAIRVKGDAS